jgi:hypothetical protein
MIERFTVDVLRRAGGWVAVVTVYRSGAHTDDTLPMTDPMDCPAKAAREASKAVRRAMAKERKGGAR